MQKEKENVDSAKKRVYVDSNVLQGAISGRNTEDVVFLNNANQQNFVLLTSIFTLMELLDIAKDRQFLIRCIVEKWTDVSTFLQKRKSKDLSKDDLSGLAKVLNNFFLVHKSIKFINIKESDWALVKKIGESSNLHSSDILHLVTAWVGDCQVLVTNDDDFVREGNMILQQENVQERLRVCNIHDAESVIEEMKLPRKVDLRVKVEDNKKSETKD